ncbi:hypothetical protein JT06_12340 [Desulfobulbus sp. Tol-SR]|jgi:hypothetical protein|nr:hypothetical protein JT06_12340 [Desulfobulbus sp. Tol-SR]
MRLTHIRNPLKRRQWEEFIESAHGKLRAENIDLRFRTVKGDGSAARASTVLPAVYFAFAQDWGRKWVELELRPRTVDGERRPQKELYSFLQANLRGRLSLPHRLTWIDEGGPASVEQAPGDEMRIKVYLDDFDEHRWIEAMVRLARRTLPFLDRFDSLSH